MMRRRSLLRIDDSISRRRHVAMQQCTSISARAGGCPSRKSHPALELLQLERSSVILFLRPAHSHSDGLLHTYGPHLSSLFAYPDLILPRTALAAENLALRQQLAVLNRKIHRPQLRRRDRFFWVILSQIWKNWQEVLINVKPETVIKWHRQGFRLYWRWKMQRFSFV